MEKGIYLNQLAKQGHTIGKFLTSSLDPNSVKLADLEKQGHSIGKSFVRSFVCCFGEVARYYYLCLVLHQFVPMAKQILN